MTDFKLKEIALDLIFLDPKNPRIPKSLHDQNEHEILKYMIDNAAVIELIYSIGENSFFPGEPIILVKEGDRYKVVEGNRRASALKLINDPALAEGLSPKVIEAATNANYKPTMIPSLIATNAKDVHKFLGFRHITGVKNWNALEKARYLNRLKEDIVTENKSITLEDIYYELAKSIGSRPDYIKRILTAYDLYLVIEENEFYKIDDLDDTKFHFVNLSDSLNRSKIATFLGVDMHNKTNPIKNLEKAHLHEWTAWLYKQSSQFTTRVKGTSAQLSMLNEIVGSTQALSAFREGKRLEEAIFLTKHIEIIFNESIGNALFYLKEADNMVHNMDAFNENLDDELKEIVKLCRKIKVIKDQKNGDEFDL